MLPRKLIIEYPVSFKNALLVRYPPTSLHLSHGAEEIIESIDKIKNLGKQSLSHLQKIQDLKQLRNELSTQFPKLSSIEKNELKIKVKLIKDEIVLLETEMEGMELELTNLESRLPNIPDPDVPIWSGYSDEEVTAIRTNLRFVHDLLQEQNSLSYDDEIIGYVKRGSGDFVYYEKV